MYFAYKERPAPDEYFLAWFEMECEKNCIDRRLFCQKVLRIDEKYAPGLIRLPRGLVSLAGHGDIPSLHDLLLFHTEYYACLPLFEAPRQAERLSTILYGTTTREDCMRDLHRKYRYCHLCAKEDREKYGRVIVHTPHQLPGVTACWKHQVLLTGDPDAKALPQTPQEARTAVFAHELYVCPTYADLSETRIFFRQSHMSASYPASASFASLASSFENAALFRACIAAPDISPVHKVICPSCGSAAYAYGKQVLCPICSKNKTVNLRQQPAASLPDLWQKAGCAGTCRFGYAKNTENEGLSLACRLCACIADPEKQLRCKK